jgi:hypothetical protein
MAGSGQAERKRASTTRVPRRPTEPTQTLKKWLATQPRARTLRQLHSQLDAFRAYYNTVRPHRALNRRTPQQAYDSRPKAIPTGTPLNDSHYRIRHDTIDPSGVFTAPQQPPTPLARFPDSG